MEGAFVVPDHKVAGAPTVGVDELPLGCMSHQRLEKLFGLRPVHADNVADMGGDVERLSAACPMGPDHCLGRRLEDVELGPVSSTPILLREVAMECMAIRLSTFAFSSSSSASQAARMSANSVKPPTGGMAGM